MKHVINGAVIISEVHVNVLDLIIPSYQIFLVTRISS